MNLVIYWRGLQAAGFRPCKDKKPQAEACATCPHGQNRFERTTNGKKIHSEITNKRPLGERTVRASHHITIVNISSARNAAGARG
jgi:hypothetical protein